MDDVGPATPSTYGGEINTPTLDRIAKMGVSFNRFHSTAMCSPTRAALLTGRNHTRVGNGQIAAIANDFDGFRGTTQVGGDGRRGAEGLRLQHRGRGKWHNTPEEQITSKGPFDYWPTGYGFEYFYGFLAGEASQYEPTLMRNTTQVTEQPPRGLPPHRRHRPPTPSTGSASRTPMPRTSRSSCTGRRALARPAPDHEGVGRQV